MILQKIVNWIKTRINTEYNMCYDQQEAEGHAVFGNCGGLTGGNWSTGYLSEECIDCPYLVLINEKGDK